jgi:putative cell wall-binding protein
LPDRVRAAFIGLVTVAASVFAAVPVPVHAAAQKVAIIVGPTGGLTDSYRSHADDVASAASAAGANVVKVYSPNATWANVRNAVNGANIIVWMGHGNGYPNPYNSSETTDRVNGWGLNRTTTNGDSDNWSSTMVYCGEKALLGTLTSSGGAAQWSYCGGSTNTDGISPAAGFVMIYAHACYTPGASEPGAADPTLSQAVARVNNYSYPPLKLGASAYYATDFGDEDAIVSRILTQRDTTYGDIFRAGRGYSSSALRTYAHPDLAGKSVWVENGTFTYAFAGNPNGTPNDPAAASTSSVDVSRLAGSNRYATSAAVSRASFAPGVSVAYVATGMNFPDALAAGAAAAERKAPVLLTAPTSLPAETATEHARLKHASIVVLGSSKAVSDGVLSALDSYTTGSVKRIAGADRYATAVKISASTFGAGVPVAYVATGANFPDALAGVPASGVKGGPVLLVAPDGIPADVQAELTRLRPGRIVILGSQAVVSSVIANALAAFTSGSVTRLAGADRYATAAAISKGTFNTAKTVYIATGLNFADALSGGPVGGIDAAPLLLVATDSVPASIADELQRLGPSEVVVLGSNRVVSDGVASQVRAILGG